MKQLFSLRALALLLLFAVATTAMAAPPQAPRNLTGVVDQNEWRSGISFTWERGSATDTIFGYRLYRAPGVDATDGFELAATMSNIDSMGMETIRYFYHIDEGAYTYRMTAFNHDGESDPSNHVSFTIAPLPSITFTSTPPTSVRVGAETVYDADAVSNTGGEIVYDLEYVPDSTGATNSISIDPATGVVRLEPRWPGYLGLTIRARLASDLRVVARQYWQMRVTNCAEPGTGISGTVVDQNGAPITDGYILYNLINEDGSETVGGSAPLTDGTYRFDTIDAGSYRLRVGFGSFVSEWYRDAYVPSEATLVEVSCGVTATADFSVVSIDPYENFIVSGTVRSKVSNELVPAILRFIGYEKGVPESHRMSRLDRRWVYTTDSVGMVGLFNVALPNTHTWIVAAESYSPMGTPGSDSLTLEFYDDATHPDAAAIIESSTEIDFKLKSRAVRGNGFSGSLRDPGGDRIDGYVVAYRLTDDGEIDEAAMTRILEGDGEWRFTNLAPGNYIVFGVPFRHGIAPGYYRADGEAALTWQEATVIGVGDAMITLNHSIRLRSVTPGGIAMLSGTVGSMPGRVLGERQSGLQGLVPVAGALVAAVDAGGTIAGTAVTDREGRFTIGGLGAGSHRVIIDKVGYFSSSATVEIREDAPNGTSVELERQETTTGAPIEGSVATMRLSARPNPAADRAVLEIEAPSAGRATVSIADAAGTVVRTATLEVAAGTSSTTVDLAGLAAGTYLVRVDGLGLPATTPVTVVR